MTSMQQGPVGVSAPSYTWGRGYRDVVRLANPPAGQPLRHTVPSHTAYLAITACLTLTTDATVANRFAELAILQGDGNPIGIFPATTAVPASSVATITWAIGCNIPSGVGGLVQVVPLPEMILDPGFTVQFSAAAEDAGDTITSALLYVLHIPTGPTGPPGRTQPLGATSGPYAPGVDVYVDTTG